MKKYRRALILNRIKEKEKIRSNADLAKLLGVKPNTLSNWYHRGSLDYDLIFTKCEGVNLNWLINGREPMRLEEEEKPSAVSDPAPVYKGVPAASVNIIEINPQAAKTNTLIADVHASAGFGSLMESTKALEQLPAIHLPNAPGGLNVAFQINGDSMHPTIRHLDFVAGNQINDVNDVKDGYTYIIVEDTDGVLCKRLYRLGEDWQIVSDNPVYPPYNRAKNRILGIFKAFCRWSYDFRNYHDDVRADIQQLKTDIQQLKGKK